MIIIKNISHDENGFPLNYNPSSYYKQNELMFNFPEYMNIDKRYLITTWGIIYNTITGKFIPQDKILYEAPFWRERGPASFLLAGDS